MGTLRIESLGTSFTIQAKEDDEYLEKIFSYYQKISKEIRENSGLRNPLQVSILTGIMICDELYKEKSNVAKLSKGETITDKDDEKASKITLELIEKLEKALQ